MIGSCLVLSKGKQSSDAKGWLSVEDLRKYLDEDHDKFLNISLSKSEAHEIQENTIPEIYNKILVAEKQIQNGEEVIDNLC